MKIIHTGDVHLGASFENLPREKARLRRVELLDGFTRLCAYAKESGVAAVLIAGDLFDNNQTASYVKKQVLFAMQSANPVQFFYVSGNHDDAFAQTDLPSNVFVFSQNRGWRSYALGEGVVVSGMDARYTSLQTLSALSLSHGDYNIAVLHGDVTGAGKDALDLRYLQNKYIDYLALGHIHKPMPDCQRLDARGVYRYCGCFEGRGFDEPGQHGFFLLEIQNKTLVDQRFFSFATRSVHEVRVDISACASYFDVESAVLNALANVGKNDTAKITLCGQTDPRLRKDVPLLQTRLSQRLFHVKIVDESRIKLDPNAFMHDATERGEFVKEVGRYSMNEEQRAEILEIGLKALAGEEIDL